MKTPYKPIAFKVLTWADFDRAISEMVREVEHWLDYQEYVIYGQPRGGLPLAVALSHRLGLPLVTLAQLQTAPILQYNKVIYLDDVFESGKTYRAFMEAQRPARFVNPIFWVQKGTLFEGHIYVETARPDEWVVFPWEVQENALEDRSSYYNTQAVVRFPVNNIYDTIQGEGVNTGVPMTLLRLHGCDVGCPWCDTKETWDFAPADQMSTLVDALGPNSTYYWATPSEIAEYVDGITPPLCTWVMLTGGEPATYALGPLVESLHKIGKKVALETSGTRLGFVGAGVDWVCVSPKLHMPGGRVFLPQTLAHADEIKMVIGKPADVQTLKDLLGSAPALKKDVQICLQPVSQSEKATQLCMETARGTGWRVSIQVHKLVNQP